MVLAAAFAVLPTGSASGATGSLDLTDAASVRLAGDQLRDSLGVAAGLGDFNGDGRDDIAIGGLGRHELAYVGHEVFVHFASTGPQLARIRSTPGLHIKYSAGYLAGEVADAGDVNGDGLADVVLGGKTSAWVVFGGPAAGTLDLTSVGARGFPITGNQNERLVSVSGVGDVNGDGLADVVIGSQTADPHGRTDAGAAYVVYGKSTTDEVRTAALGKDGFQIAGAESGDGVGDDVAGPGDVNGDGRGDVLLGRGPYDPGDVNVVFTPADQSDIDLALDHPGFAIGPIKQGDVAAAGDTNGDGRPDLLVGDTSADSDDCAAVFVVFGKASFERVDLKSLGAAGLKIRASSQIELLGSHVGPAGDANGDGLSDVVVYSRVSFLERPCGISGGGIPSGDAGVAWVVFGRDSGGEIELGDLGPNGFRIMSRPWSGRPLAFGSAIGDRDGDGRDDIGIVEAQTCLREGSVYIVPSPASPEGLPEDPWNRPAETWRGTPLRDQRLGTAFDDALFGELDGDCLDGANGADKLSGGDGDDVLVGGLGADVLAGDAGNDRLSPAGFEAYNYPGDPDVLLGGPGDDTLGSEEFSDNRGSSSFGELGDDRFAGDNGNDVIDAGIGDDTASGGRGDDRVSGDSGNDRVTGNAGDDRLHGEAGNDVVAGGVGNDVMGLDILGGSYTEVGDDLYAGDDGNDVIGAGTGNDIARGGRGNDSVSGGYSGDDRLAGGPGDDFVSGGKGRDRLRGRGGRDEFVAGPGKDFVHSRDGIREVIRCGRGQDTVKADHLDRLIACEIAK